MCCGVCVCVCARARACVRACVRAYSCVYITSESLLTCGDLQQTQTLFLKRHPVCRWLPPLPSSLRFSTSSSRQHSVGCPSPLWKDEAISVSFCVVYSVQTHQFRHVRQSQFKYVDFVLSLLYVQYVGFLLCITSSPVSWFRFVRYIQSKHTVFVLSVTFSPNTLFSFCPLRSVQIHYFCFVRYTRKNTLSVFVLSVLIG